MARRQTGGQTVLESVSGGTPSASQRALAELPRTVPDPSRIAVLLNRNARRVSDRMARKMERIVGSDHFFFSRNLDEAEAFTREIIQRGYGTIVCGGGDGTLAQSINLVQNYVQESNAWRAERYARYGEVQKLLTAPRFAFLRLGTGNGISGVVGAGHPMEDLKRLVEYAPGRTHEIPLVENEGERFFFCGMGYDSLILNDYNALKARTHNPLLKPLMHSVLGYFAATFLRTIPRIFLHRRATKLEGRVVNRGRAYYIDPRRGDAAIEVEPGATLFEGLTSIVAAGTSPFYGYGMKMFPFANLVPRMMHLRIATIGPVASLAHLPSLWKGAYRSPRRVLDFLVEDVSVELDRPFPFQHSGDAQGLRTEVDLKVAPEPLRMVDYYPPRITH